MATRMAQGLREAWCWLRTRHHLSEVHTHHRGGVTVVTKRCFYCGRRLQFRGEEFPMTVRR